MKFESNGYFIALDLYFTRMFYSLVSLTSNRKSRKDALRDKYQRDVRLVIKHRIAFIVKKPKDFACMHISKQEGCQSIEKKRHIPRR